MKLAPVTAWLVRDRPRLKVVETGITREVLGICVRRGDDALRDAINETAMKLSSVVRFLRARWTYWSFVRELSNYSDHELLDIGIDRADIHEITRLGSREQ